MQAQEEVIMIKGKRSKRPRLASPLALTVATSSSSTADLSGGGGGGFCGGVISDVSGNSDRVIPSPSNSGELTQSSVEEEEDMANCLILLAKGQGQRSSQPLAASGNKVAVPVAAEVYQCKTCNKSFPSFQALGGHRASHKRPNKPITLDEKKPLREKQEDFQSNRDDSTILSLQMSNRVLGSPSNKSRVHECSICRAEFTSGQALGGHMRRHRPIPAAPSSSHGESQEVKRPRNLLSLDLNLPAQKMIIRNPSFLLHQKNKL
ncbi:hypothetical protein Pfo_028716 [Paulownia fortunei]|nr:hypothetical protein Pfo_028715 [Paulownia fortunei]KAI3472028.1 hypothetical protein Pfo_028716 [Paulownia fortunei]